MSVNAQSEVVVIWGIYSIDIPLILLILNELKRG